jgi:CheY-like chemotaxis protein/anti-sigma regulatory factor (Ser/Thr protein kinase)
LLQRGQGGVRVVSESTASGQRPLVLVADDDTRVRATLVALLETQGYRVAQAADGLECLQLIRTAQPQIVVLDLGMPKRDGFAVLDELPHLDLDTELPDVIVLTGRAGAADGIRAVRAGAIGFLTKPARSSELFTAIRRATEAREAAAYKREVFGDSHKTWTCQIRANRANARWLAQQLAVELAAFVFDGDPRPRRLQIAVDEALTNAIIHGALEVDSSLKDQASVFEEVVSAREADPEWSSRLVRVACDFLPSRVEIVITDPGRGFDAAALPDPADVEAVLACHGRGILMMRALVDEVEFENGGRTVRLAMRPVQTKSK